MISISFLSACGKASFESVSKETIKSVKDTFDEQVKETNKKSGNMHFYLPFGYEIENESPNNIILKNGSKTYILFNNPQENTTSDVVYKATVALFEELDVNEKFKKEDRLGFVIIKRLEEDMNELTIGVGGTKITTQVKTSNMKTEAVVMTQIANSVENDN